MPQLDSSYYISQITWLLISFFLFFCLSKFLLLPQLNRILLTRQNFINENINFANTMMQKVNSMNQDYNNKIKANNEELSNKIDLFIKQCKTYEQKKINSLKKKLNEDRNKTILQLNNKLQNETKLAQQHLVEIISHIIANVYKIIPDEKKIKELLHNDN